MAEDPDFITFLQRYVLEKDGCWIWKGHVSSQLLPIYLSKARHVINVRRIFWIYRHGSLLRFEDGKRLAAVRMYGVCPWYGPWCLKHTAVSLASPNRVAQFINSGEDIVIENGYLVLPDLVKKKRIRKRSRPPQQGSVLSAEDGLGLTSTD